jgi:Leucine-rich repeat (LRR) protein
MIQLFEEIDILRFYDKLGKNKFQIEYNEHNNIIVFDCSSKAQSIIPQEFIDEKLARHEPRSALVGLKYVQIFKCNHNLLNTLDLTKLTQLKELYCNSNKLQQLDLSKNTQLKVLICSFNKLTNLTLSANILLKKLDCLYNYLLNLEISKCVYLEHINCEYNMLLNINTSKNRLLKVLFCAGNKRNEINLALELTENINITYLECDNEYTGGDMGDLYFWKHVWKFIKKRREKLTRPYFDKWKSMVEKRKLTLIYKCFKNIKEKKIEITSSCIPIDLYNDYVQLIK